MKYAFAALLAIVGFAAVIGASAGVTAQHLETVVVPGDPFSGGCVPVVTQPYGPTDFVGEPIIDGVRFHTGIDLACPAGVAVHTVTAGLAHTATGWSGGYGNNVVIELITSLPGDPAPQPYFVRYAHLQDAGLVPDGTLVSAGQTIGLEGSSGFSTGPHLHFEVDRGRPDASHSIDPALFLKRP
jgi:murein DD-endopeptidase MepM/ murein hydrolase activator NlpD